MTRRHKFQMGDLVVLRKGVLVENYPRESTDVTLNEAISARTTIRHVVKHSSSYNPTLEAGKVGVVKGYHNVFMLDRTTCNENDYKKLKPEKQAECVEGTQNSYYGARNGKYYHVNEAQCNHLIVLIEGMLVAFKQGGKLFESAQDTLNRFSSVRVTFSGDMVIRGVNEKETEAKIKRRLNSLKQLLENGKVTQIEFTDREGNVVTKQSDR